MVANLAHFELGQSNELIVMNRGFQPITELDSVSVRSVDWGTHDHTDCPGWVSDPIVGGHHVLLCDNLSAGRVDHKSICYLFHVGDPADNATNFWKTCFRVTKRVKAPPHNGANLTNLPLTIVETSSHGPIRLDH